MLDTADEGEKRRKELRKEMGMKAAKKEILTQRRGRSKVTRRLEAGTNHGKETSKNDSSNIPLFRSQDSGRAKKRSRTRAKRLTSRRAKIQPSTQAKRRA